MHTVPTQVKTTAPCVRSAAPKVVGRREAFALVAGLVALAPKAEALGIPSQESTGSTGKRGSLPPNSSEASMSSYTMEGIKKRGISAKKKEALLAETRAAAQAGKYTD